MGPRNQDYPQQREPSFSVCLCILLSILNGSCLATPWVYALVANSGRLVNPAQNHDQGW